MAGWYGEREELNHPENVIASLAFERLERGLVSIRSFTVRLGCQKWG